MENQDGSKLMTGYILVCFVLAAGALVGYKVMNDKRVELADEYKSVGKKYVEIRDYQSRSLHNYYKEPARVEKRIEQEERVAKTAQILEDIADGIGIKMDGNKGDNKFSIKAEPPPKADSNDKNININTIKIELDGVTTANWQYFVMKARNKIGDYAHMQEFKAVRSNQKFDKMSLLDKRKAGDSTRWKVTITYKWFTKITS
ncbi:MAG: hypothetical protein V3V10_03555 [Planctomycetota bacterium]